MNHPQTQPAKLGPLLAVLGLLLATWFGLTQTASAVFLPPNHSDLFAATLSPAEHQENSSLLPENRVWENFGNPNEITPADELNSLQLRWESHFGELENASGVLSYADGNPINLSDPFGLCATQAQWDRAMELWEADRARLPDPAIRDATFDVQFALGVPGIARGLTELGAAAIVKGLSALGRGTARGVANEVPALMARVIPDTPITRASGTLGRPTDLDVFVTGASDISGLNAQQISQRLTIPQSPTGFRVVEFPTPSSGVASPVFRTDPGFIGGGKTLGGAREFVIPNGAIPSGSRTTIIGP